MKKLLLLLLLLMHEVYVNIKQEVIQWFKKCGIINAKEWNGDDILFDQNIGIPLFFPTNRESDKDEILFDRNIEANNGISLLIPINTENNENDIFFNQDIESNNCISVFFASANEKHWVCSRFWTKLNDIKTFLLIDWIFLFKYFDLFSVFCVCLQNVCSCKKPMLFIIPKNTALAMKSVSKKVKN